MLFYLIRDCRQTQTDTDKQTDKQAGICLPNSGNRFYSEPLKITAQARHIKKIQKNY